MKLGTITSGTMTSDGRWFGWRWTVPCPESFDEPTPGFIIIRNEITGYSFTKSGARRAIRRVLLKRARRSTIEVGVKP